MAQSDPDTNRTADTAEPFAQQPHKTLPMTDDDTDTDTESQTHQSNSRRCDDCGVIGSLGDGYGSMVSITCPSCNDRWVIEPPADTSDRPTAADTAKTESTPVTESPPPTIERLTELIDLVQASNWSELPPHAKQEVTHATDALTTARSIMRDQADRQTHNDDTN